MLAGEFHHDILDHLLKLPVVDQPQVEIPGPPQPVRLPDDHYRVLLKRRDNAAYRINRAWICSGSCRPAGGGKEQQKPDRPPARLAAIEKINHAGTPPSGRV